MIEEINNEVVLFFTSRGKFPEGRSKEYLDINYISSGLLESIEFITLITEIEEKYDISFTNEEIQSPQFRTISGIVSMINTHLKVKNGY
jgi:hypothetical protein